MRQVEEARQVADSMRAGASTLDAHGLGAHARSGRCTSSSRPNAWTISIPTTASSADSVMSALRCLDVARDRRHLVGERHVRYAIVRQRDARATASIGLVSRGHRGAQDHHRRSGRALDDAPADEVPDRVEVVRRARDDLPRRVPVVERARAGQVGAVEQLAHRRLHPDADARGRVAAQEVDGRADGREPGDDRQLRRERAVVVQDRAVDDARDQQRDRDRQRAVDQGVAQRDRRETALAAPDVPEAGRRDSGRAGRGSGTRLWDSWGEGCAIEMIATTMARYDLARFGAEVFRPSPRQADLMIVSGTVTKKMAPQVVRLYNQMPEPKYVIAMGACAISGGPFRDGYNVLKGIDRFIPVDVHIPGCPPRPEALIHAFMTLQDKISAQQLTGESRPRHLKQDLPSEFPVPEFGEHGLEPAQNDEVFHNPLKVLQG